MRRITSRVLPWEACWSVTVLPASRGDGMGYQTSAESIVSAGSSRHQGSNMKTETGANTVIHPEGLHPEFWPVSVETSPGSLSWMKTEPASLIERAYRRVVANKGAPGVDGMTVYQLADHLKQHWPALREYEVWPDPDQGEGASLSQYVPPPPEAHRAWHYAPFAARTQWPRPESLKHRYDHCPTRSCRSGRSVQPQQYVRAPVSAG